MKKVFLLMFIALLSVKLHGQQVAEINLIRPHPGKLEMDLSDVVPKGCKSPKYIEKQGEIKHKNSDLKIEFQLDGQRNFERGETIRGRVLLQNCGTEDIE